METGDIPERARKAFRQLKAALTAGELELAQQAYAEVAQHAPPVSGKPNSVLAAFEELGVVLGSNDVGKARVAFEILESFLEVARAAAPQRGAAGNPAAGRKKVNLVG